MGDDYTDFFDAQCTIYIDASAVPIKITIARANEADVEIHLDDFDARAFAAEIIAAVDKLDATT